MGASCSVTPSLYRVMTLDPEKQAHWSLKGTTPLRQTNIRPGEGERCEGAKKDSKNRIFFFMLQQKLHLFQFCRSSQSLQMYTVHQASDSSEFDSGELLWFLQVFHTSPFLLLFQGCMLRSWDDFYVKGEWQQSWISSSSRGCTLLWVDELRNVIIAFSIVSAVRGTADHKALLQVPSSSTAVWGVGCVGLMDGPQDYLCLTLISHTSLFPTTLILWCDVTSPMTLSSFLLALTVGATFCPLVETSSTQFAYTVTSCPSQTGLIRHLRSFWSNISISKTSIACTSYSEG